MRAFFTILLIVLSCCGTRADEAFPGDGWWAVVGYYRVAGHSAVILHFNRQEPPDVPQIPGLRDPWAQFREFPNQTWSVTVYRYEFEYGGPKSVKISQESFPVRITKEFLMVSDGEKVSSYQIESTPDRMKLVLVDDSGQAPFPIQRGETGSVELAKSTKEAREEIRKQALAHFP